MADRSKIEWTDASWNPIRARNLRTGKIGWHCVHVSEGCRNCYAEGINKRLGTGLEFKPGHLDQGIIEVFLDEKTLIVPLRWKKPRKIFVGSMTDLFGDWATDAMLDRIFAVMALCPRHTFQILTKRAERMRSYVESLWPRREHLGDLMGEIGGPGREGCYAPECDGKRGWVGIHTPLPNVWLGTSCEDQPTADERIPLLLQTPAAVRFVSLEPLLWPIDLVGPGASIDTGRNWLEPWGRNDFIVPGIDWVIVGGESGPHARPMSIQWARELRDQCKAAKVSFFFKQWGGLRPKAAGRLLDGVEHNGFPEVAHG